jgi:hypothetical protein
MESLDIGGGVELLSEFLAWFQPFLALALWKQILILSVLFIVIEFLVALYLELGPLASSSPLSGGGGFLAVGIVDFIIFLLSFGVDDAWRWYLRVPILGGIGLLVIIIVFGQLWDKVLTLIYNRRTKKWRLKNESLD